MSVKSVNWLILQVFKCEKTVKFVLFRTLDIRVEVKRSVRAARTVHHLRLDDVVRAATSSGSQLTERLTAPSITGSISSSSSSSSRAPSQYIPSACRSRRIVNHGPASPAYIKPKLCLTPNPIKGNGKVCQAPRGV